MTRRASQQQHLGKMLSLFSILNSRLPLFLIINISACEVFRFRAFLRGEEEAVGHDFPAMLSSGTLVCMGFSHLYISL
jgi:hypothetical protein